MTFAKLDEQSRLLFLFQTAILDTPPEAFFEDIVDLVSQSLDVPIALVSLVDESRQWFKARRGVSISETSRDTAFCDRCIAAEGPLVVSDATHDARFRDNPLVTSAPFVVAYLGAPIILESGARLGTVCAMDHAPRKWSSREILDIERSARFVSAHLDARKSHLERDRHKFLERSLMHTQLRYQSVIDSMSEGMVIHGPSGAIVDYNLAACEILGLSEDELLGRTSRDPRWRSIRPSGEDFPGDEHPAMVTLRTSVGQKDIIMGVETPDGERRWISVTSYPMLEAKSRQARQVIVVFKRIEVAQLRSL